MNEKFEMNEDAFRKIANKIIINKKFDKISIL